VKLIVGLGNPGIAYQFTPHNLGFLTIDRIANDRGVEVRNRQCHALTARTEIGDEQVLLAKPETFMNLSGMSVRELVAKHEITLETDLIVIYDELDLPLGRDSHPAAGQFGGPQWHEVDHCGSGHAGVFTHPAGSLAGAEDCGWRQVRSDSLSQVAAEEGGRSAGQRRRSGKRDFAGRPGCGHEPLQPEG
jgi:hypothetical protein